MLDSINNFFRLLSGGRAPSKPGHMSPPRPYPEPPPMPSPPPMHYDEFLESVQAYFNASHRVREEAYRFARVGEDGMTMDARVEAGAICELMRRWEELRRPVEEGMEE